LIFNFKTHSHIISFIIITLSLLLPLVPPSFHLHRHYSIPNTTIISIPPSLFHPTNIVIHHHISSSSHFHHCRRDCHYYIVILIVTTITISLLFYHYYCCCHYYYHHFTNVIITTITTFIATTVTHLPPLFLSNKVR